MTDLKPLIAKAANGESLSRSEAREAFNVLMSGEDPNVAGRYLAVDTQEFGMFASGQIVAFGAAPGTNAASVTVQYVSNRATAFVQANANNIGHFRDPLPTSGGDLVAAFTATPGAATNGGTVANPQPNYAFRLYRLTQNGGVGDFVPGTTLTCCASCSAQLPASSTRPCWSTRTIDGSALTLGRKSMRVRSPR